MWRVDVFFHVCEFRCGRFSEGDLASLPAVSRGNNERLGITGMLLYKDGNFMQVLEGEEEVVWGFTRRCAKTRATGGRFTLNKGRSEERNFPEWTMGFQNLDSPEARSTPGYDEFLNTSLTGREFSGNPSRSQKLLPTFKRSM